MRRSFKPAGVGRRSTSPVLLPCFRAVPISSDAAELQFFFRVFGYFQVHQPRCVPYIVRVLLMSFRRPTGVHGVTRERVRVSVIDSSWVIPEKAI